MNIGKGICPTVLVGLLALAPLSAVSQQNESPQGSEKGTLKRVDPSDFFTQFQIRNEYRVLQDGGEVNLLKPRLDYAFSKTFLIRLEVPVVYSDLDLPEMDSETGLGDILLRGAFRAARGEGYAVVAAAEFILDTATDPALGLGKDRFGPLVFASIEVPSLRSRFFPVYQHVFSFAGDENRPDINYASIRPSVILTKWPNNWYTVIDPNFFVDFERQSKSGMTLELEVGRPVKKNVNVWVRPGIGVFGDIPQVYDWNLEVGVRYYFR